MLLCLLQALAYIWDEKCVLNYQCLGKYLPIPCFGIIFTMNLNKYLTTFDNEDKINNYNPTNNA